MVVVLHGRELELRELEAHLAAVTADRGRGVTLVGPAGIGKTALLSAAADAARAGGVRVLRARGSEAEQAVPYGVIRQLLGPAAQDPELVIQGGAARGRALVLGEELATSDEATLALDVCWLVADVAAVGPIALCVDDLHWVDGASLRILDLLRVRLDGLSVLFLTATRTLPEGGWASDASMYQVLVRPLSSDAVAHMLEDTLGDPAPDLADACAEVTGGNPFLVREILRSLQSTGGSPDAATVRSLVPESIVRATATRLAALPNTVVRLAQAAALLGDDIDLGRAATVAGIDSDEASSAADTLTRESILAPVRPLRFVHPLLLAAVRDAVPPHERSELHARASRALRTEPGGLDLACAHLLEVDPAGDPDVVTLLQRGAEQAMGRGASEAAVAYLRRALTEPPATPLEESIVTLELAQAAYRAQAPDAIELSVVAVERATEPGIVVAATLNAGHLITLSGKPEDAIELTHSVLRRHDLPAPMVEACEALALGWSLCSTEAHARSSSVVAEARARSRRSDAPRTLRAMPTLEAAMADGDVAKTIALAKHAWDDGELLREVGPETPLSGMVLLAVLIAGDMALASRWNDRVIEASAAVGSVIGRASGVAWRAWIRDAEGDPGSATAYAEEAIAVDQRSGALQMLLPIPYAFLARSALVTAGPAPATEALDRLPPAARDPRMLTSPIWWLQRAEVALAAGRPEDALADVAEVAAWQRQWPAPAGGWTLWHPVAVEAHIALGDESHARSLASVGIQRATAWGAPRPLARALRAAACTLPVEDRLSMLDEAIELTDRGLCGLDGAGYRIDAAESHLARGDGAAAVALLQKATQMADRAGARAISARGTAALEQHGVRVDHAEIRVGIHDLTPSERRVVDLAAGGSTNREIAESLFLTEKTVESHLTSAYRKLGIRSRNDLTAAIEPR